MSQEYDQTYGRFPAWAPQPPYRANGRPTVTMVEYLDRWSRQHMVSQHSGVAMVRVVSERSLSVVPLR